MALRCPFEGWGSTAAAGEDRSLSCGVVVRTMIEEGGVECWTLCVIKNQRTDRSGDEGGELAL